MSESGMLAAIRQTAVAEGDNLSSPALADASPTSECVRLSIIKELAGSPLVVQLKSASDEFAFVTQPAGELRGALQRPSPTREWRLAAAQSVRDRAFEALVKLHWQLQMGVWVPDLRL